MGDVFIKRTGGGGLSDNVTAKLSDVLPGYTAITSDSEDEAKEGTMSLISSQAVTPAISGDYFQFKVPANGWCNNNVDFTYAASNLGTATENQILNTAIATSQNGWRIQGKIPVQAAKTVDFKTAADTTSVPAGLYLSGAITLSAVTQTNLAAANIKTGATITISKGNGTNLWSYAGSMPTGGYASGTCKITDKGKTTINGKQYSSNAAWSSSGYRIGSIKINPGFVPLYVVAIANDANASHSSQGCKVVTAST